MATIQWQMHIDTLRNGLFGASIDDVSAYLLDVNWTNGFMSNTTDVTSFDNVAPPARLTATLVNSSKAFNPETLGSELLANGNFSTWSAGNPSSWTVTGESGSDPEVSQVAADKSHGGGGTGAANLYTTGTALTISQTILTNGTSYLVTLTVSQSVANSGGIRLYNGVTPISYIIHDAGDYTFAFNATATSFGISTIGVCDMTIDNVSVKSTSLYGRFIVPGTLVRFRAIYNSTTYDLFYGTISLDRGVSFTTNPIPSSGSIREMVVQIVAEDAMLKLLDAEYVPPLLTNVTIDIALQRMFDDAVIIWPYPTGKTTLLDVQGTMELDYSAQLFEHSITSFETGQTTLSYVGDFADKGKGVSAQGYIRDLESAEVMGRFWWEARENKFKFHNRLHDALNTTIAATFTESAFERLDSSYGDDLINEITINHTLRSTGAANTVMWVAKEMPVELTYHSSKTFTAHYVDPNNDQIRIGLKEGTPLQPSVDYVGNYAQDGTSSDLSRFLTVSIEWGASSAKITVSNISRRRIWLTYLQVRGTPFYWQEHTVTKRDGDSIRDYQYAPARPIDLRLVDTSDFAEQIAAYMIALYKKPVFRFTSARIKADATNLATGLARKIGDKITITDSFTGHSGDYVIVGERHRINERDVIHDVDWALKPVSREKIAQLDRTGYSELDSGIILGL